MTVASSTHRGRGPWRYQLALPTNQFISTRRVDKTVALSFWGTPGGADAALQTTCLLLQGAEADFAPNATRPEKKKSAQCAMKPSRRLRQEKATSSKRVPSALIE
jgi:hypothetical protein